MAITRISQFIEREFTGVHQAAFLLATTTVLAKLLALIRDRLLASTFGAGEALDVYYASFRIPDLLYTVSLFLAASTALIPILLEKESEGREASRRFIGSVVSWFIIFVAALSVILFFTMPFFARMIIPGFHEGSRTTVILLSRILLLQAIFLGFSNIAASVIQSFRLFLIYALSAILYNLGIILGVIFFYPAFGIAGLAIGAVLGAFFHFTIQLPALIRMRFFPSLSFAFPPALKKAITSSLPRTLALSLNQIVFIIITAFASFFGLGSIAVFQLAYNLETVPISVIGLSYSVAAFPFLAYIARQKNKKEFVQNVLSVMRHIFFWSLPAAVLIIVLRAQIVRVILGAGNFGWIDTRLTSAALALFTLSLLSESLIMLFVRAFYASGRTFLPLFINAIGACVIVASTLFFAHLYDASYSFYTWFGTLMRVSDLGNVKVLVLPLAFSFGSIVNLILLSIFFFRRWGSLDDRDFWRSIAEVVGASFIIGIISFWALRVLDNIFNLETFVGIFFQGLSAGLIGIAGGALILSSLKNRELREIQKSLYRRFWKKIPVVSSEPTSGSGI